MTRDEITDQLLQQCTKSGVTCLYAVESGSRGWGFASPDSDYDVRFLYIRPQDDYLRIVRPRDTIEHVADELDLVGWDVTKALALLQKSNPSIVEWLCASDVYYQDPVAGARLQTVMRHYFDPHTLVTHYASVAAQHYDKYIRDQPTVAPKKYLYALRAVLSAGYVARAGQPAPIVFRALLAESSLDQPVSHAIHALLSIKSGSVEKQQFASDPILDNYVARSIESLRQLASKQRPPTDSSTIDQCFLELLNMPRTAAQ